MRLDRLLVERGLAPARHRARELIEAGDVLVDGLPVTKVAAQVDVERPVRLRKPDPGWVSRGALKLDPVLTAWGIDVEGQVAADLGASTGGFSQVLLRRGIAKVYAVDVGRGLLHERVARDPRTVVMDGVNVRYLEALPDPIDWVVADLSFISVDKVIDAVHRILAPTGHAVLLVKPQFEVGREHVGTGGLVKDAEAREAAIAQRRARCGAAGFDVVAGMDSPLAGAKSGNVEHFLHLVKRTSATPSAPE
ncbi:MAG: TlyA family RNA methyltransferase [Myxococcota bacterium]